MRVCSKHGCLQKKRFQTLVNDEHMGDCKPSQLLQHTWELLEDAPADSTLIKQLFFSRLPQNVQEILALIVEINSVDHLVGSADRIVDITRQPASSATFQLPAEVSSFSSVSTHDTNQSLAILQAIEQLTKEVKRLNVSRSQLLRHRFWSPSPNKQTNLDSASTSRFCAAAHNCKQPCSFTNQGNWFKETWVRHSLLKHYLITVPFS